DEHEQLGAELTGQVRTGRRDAETTPTRQTPQEQAEKGWIYLTGVVTEPGTNAASNKGAVWIGPGGTYTKTFNNAGEDLILIIWAPMLRGSTPNKPLITLDSSTRTHEPRALRGLLSRSQHERPRHEHRWRSTPR